MALFSLATMVAGRVATAADLPTAGPVAPVTTLEDTPAEIDLSGTDQDGDSLTFAIVDGPAHGSLGSIGDPNCILGQPSSCEASVTYTPSADYSGPDAFTFTVDDGVDGTSTAAAVQITVTAQNDSPIAGDDVSQTSEDVPQVIPVFALLANDSDVDPVAILTISALDATSAQGGTIADNGDDTMTYTPPGDYDGPDSFGYTLSDGSGGTDTATVSITVHPVNDPPVAVDDDPTILEDAGVVILDVVDNDTDVEGQMIEIVDATQPDHGHTVVQNGILRYVTALNFNGVDTFSYTAEDELGDQDTATVSVTVDPVNDVPTADSDAASGAEDQPLTIAVLNGDADVDGDTLTIVDTTNGAHGAVAITMAGTRARYVPAANYFGTDSFAYTISDGHGGEATATVTLSVAPVNDAPTAADDGSPAPLAVAQNTGPTALNVLANDTALPDTGETISIVAVTQGGHGVVAIFGGGSGLTYDPSGSFTGLDLFTYTVSDGLLSATATVHVNVSPDISPPVTAIRVVGTASATASSIRVTVKWSAVELQSGITLYQLQQQTDGGAWTTISLPTPTTTLVERVLAGGHDYRFRVRARDGIGNLGAYTTSGPLRF